MIDIEVEDWELDDDLYDKTIEETVLWEIKDNAMQVNVLFNSPSNITSDVASPDSLNVRFLLPHLILDAET